jgi:CheY-like chemotaxis protein
MKLRVYVFDDDEVVRNVVRQLIERIGHEVVCFDHPQQCEILNSPKCECPEGTQCADVILSDRMFGEQDCLAFVAKQKERDCKAHMAFMSAAFSREDHAWADKNNITVFSKPFPCEILADWLKSVELETSPDRKLVEFGRSH